MPIEPTTQSVFWKLPGNLVEDCHDRDGENWAQGFRDLLAKWCQKRQRLHVPTAPVSKSFSMYSEVLERLEAEAERLTKETGQQWSAMQVGREIWHQQQVRSRRNKRSR
jgi:hypothetical protein